MLCNYVMFSARSSYSVLIMFVVSFVLVYCLVNSFTNSGGKVILFVFCIFSSVLSFLSKCWFLCRKKSTFFVFFYFPVDSSLLSFLQKQRSKHKDVKSDNISNEATTSNEDDKAVEDSAMNSLEKPTNSSFCPYDEFNIDKDMPGMSVVEDEKLEWMKDTAKHLCKEDQVSHQCYFL